MTESFHRQVSGRGHGGAGPEADSSAIWIFSRMIPPSGPAARITSVSLSSEADGGVAEGLVGVPGGEAEPQGDGGHGGERPEKAGKFPETASPAVG